MKQIRIRVQLRFKRVAIAVPRAIIVLNICARRKVDRVNIISTISNSSIIVLIDLYCIRFYDFTRVLEKSIDKISVGEFSKFFFTHNHRVKITRWLYTVVFANCFINWKFGPGFIFFFVNGDRINTTPYHWRISSKIRTF